MDTLVDTSVWIDFLRGVEHPRVRLLEALLEDGEASLCEVSYAEICFGARDERQLKKYAAYFSELPFLKLPPDWHRKAAEMGYALRRSGFKPFLADLMIAMTALSHEVPLLTSDRDFEPFRKLFGLSVE